MSRNIHGRGRVVTATFGSLGDVHPYVAPLEERQGGFGLKAYGRRLTTTPN